MRHGVSILEVMFAILVVTVGLMGAIAIFPLAATNARRAKVNDMMAAAGRSAVHDFDVRGMRRPELWIAWNQATGSFVSDFVSGGTCANWQVGESLCIDPRLISAQMKVLSVSGVPFATLQPPNLPDSRFVQTFPYTEPYSDQNGDAVWQSGEPFVDVNGNGMHDPWQSPATATVNAGGVSFDTSLMRRITLHSGLRLPSGLLAPASQAAMLAPQANNIFTIDDDLSYLRDNDKTMPAFQNQAGLPVPLNALMGKRQTEGQLSWLATLVPLTDAASVPSDEYTLSVVMLQGRTDPYVDITQSEPTKLKERTVLGMFQNGTGATGGEITLYAYDAAQLKLRANEWVMVSGTYLPVAGVPSQPYSRFQWYRVSACESEPSFNSSNPAHQQFELNATLTGPDWNISMVSPYPPNSLTPPTGLGYNRVTIIEGAYTVYEKTIRLERGSSF